MLAWSIVRGVVAGLLAVTGPASADDKKDDKKPAGPVVLKVVSKKDKYVFDGGGRTPKDYKAYLEGAAKKIAAGQLIPAPKAIPVDLVLQFENTSKEGVTLFMGGDSNEYVFELTGGDGTVTMNNPIPFTTEFRSPKAVTIEAGKTHEIPVKQLIDGNRGLARLVFWTGPGDYQLVAKYRLTDKNGLNEKVLTSEAIKIVVGEK